MDEDPKEKKAKLSSKHNKCDSNLKRGDDVSRGSPTKRFKSDNTKELGEHSIQKMKRQNFITACRQVSYKAYFDVRRRLQLLYLPSCINGVCNHQDDKSDTKSYVISTREVECFNIEFKSNMWCEALDVCQISITQEKYLSDIVLKNIVEIMMNAHEDEFGRYKIPHLLNRCQQILALNFNTHPPCQIKDIKDCYKSFLTSPMDKKEKTYTNRTEFKSENGIVKYCMNRLESELDAGSKDEALFDPFENTPEEMNSVQARYWKKEKLKIFELLERPERIKRIMAVLESIIELLQYDLAIWISRYKNRPSSRALRSQKPLMAFMLWSDNVFHRTQDTGTMNYNCKQIIRLFVYFVHLGYHQKFIKIMVAWVNVIIQTCYWCERNSCLDYPNISLNPDSYCSKFAQQFYNLIADLPQASILKILEYLKPTCMQFMVGTLHLKSLLSLDECDPIEILISFLKNKQWKQFKDYGSSTIELEKSFVRPKKIKRKLKKLSAICKNFSPSCETMNMNCPKMSEIIKNDEDVNLNIVVHTLYIVTDAYLDAYSVQNFQETLDMNESLASKQIETLDNLIIGLDNYRYIIGTDFIKNYRNIYQMLQQVTLQFRELKKKGELPEILEVFEKIGFE